MKAKDSERAVQRGDVMALLGNERRVHLLVCEDPTIAEVAAKFFKSVEVGAVIAEPPQEGRLDHGWSDWVESWLARIRRFAEAETSLLFVVDWRLLAPATRAIDAAGWKRYGMCSLASEDGHDPKHLLIASLTARRAYSRVLWGDQPIAQLLESLPGSRSGTVVNLFGGRSITIAEHLGLEAMGFEPDPRRFSETMSRLSQDRFCISAQARRYYQVIRHLSRGRPIRVAAELAGIDRSKIYRAREEDPAFDKAISILQSGTPR